MEHDSYFYATTHRLSTMNRLLWDEISNQVAESIGAPVHFQSTQPISGGDSSPAFRLSTSDEDYFVKLGPAPRLDMFSAEADGLETIARTGTIRCPRPYIYGVAQAHAFLVLEYIPFSSRGDQAILGSALAKLHTHSAPRYGWHRDNTLGLSTQVNFMEDNWATFWSKHRLDPQLHMAQMNRAPSSLIDAGQQLVALLPTLLGHHNPPPALLHGDLWRGNCAFDTNGQPVIFDPAVYCGDREAELGMCDLFGGFGPEFWAAYTHEWPLPEGHQKRRKLYMLYHVLNHFNLFGGAYGSQALHLIMDLLAQAR